MFRSRVFFKLESSGGWNDAIALVGQLNEVAAQRGWSQTTVWTQTVGPFNELLLEQDYPDLSAFQREQEAFYADEEAMALVMNLDKLVRSDVGHNELWQKGRPSRIARLLTLYGVRDTRDDGEPSLVGDTIDLFVRRVDTEAMVEAWDVDEPEARRGTRGGCGLRSSCPR